MGILQQLEVWNTIPHRHRTKSRWTTEHHEVGAIDVERIDVVWKAALKHGTRAGPPGNNVSSIRCRGAVSTVGVSPCISSTS